MRVKIIEWSHSLGPRVEPNVLFITTLACNFLGYVWTNKIFFLYVESWAWVEKFKLPAIGILTLVYPGADPIKLYFLRFPIFAVKLGHFIVDTFLSYVPNTQAYQRKTEKFFASEEKEFYRIGSWSLSSTCGDASL